MDAFVDSNTFVYCDRADRNRPVASDCYVALGVDTKAMHWRNGYFLWEMGESPDCVLEITSESMASHDLIEERALYAGIGVGEYWRFDPSGGDYHGDPPRPVGRSMGVQPSVGHEPLLER